jgi:hypothetical protein
MAKRKKSHQRIVATRPNVPTGAQDDFGAAALKENPSESAFASTGIKGEDISGLYSMDDLTMPHGRKA